jgi:hypothetical protein
MISPARLNNTACISWVADKGFRHRGEGRLFSGTTMNSPEGSTNTESVRELIKTLSFFGFGPATTATPLTQPGQLVLNALFDPFCFLYVNDGMDQHIVLKPHLQPRTRTGSLRQSINRHNAFCFVCAHQQHSMPAILNAIDHCLLIHWYNPS